MIVNDQTEFDVIIVTSFIKSGFGTSHKRNKETREPLFLDDSRHWT